MRIHSIEAIPIEIPLGRNFGGSTYTVPFGAGPVAVFLSWGLFTLGTSRRHRRSSSVLR